MTALFRQIGGGEIDDNPLRWQRQTAGVKRRANPIGASPTALSGRPTTAKCGRPGAICTWTSTGIASMPRKATVVTWLTIKRFPIGTRSRSKSVENNE